MHLGVFLQVWFQNSRARQKRKAGKAEEAGSASTPPSLTAASPPDQLKSSTGASLSDSSLHDDGRSRPQRPLVESTSKSISMTSLGGSSSDAGTCCANLPDIQSFRHCSVSTTSPQAIPWISLNRNVALSCLFDEVCSRTGPKLCRLTREITKLPKCYL